MTYTIYHNPRCSTSRKTLDLLRAHAIEPVIVEYLKTPLDADEIRALLKMLDKPPRALMRAKEALYKEHGLGEESLCDEDLIGAMAHHPILMERPVVVRGAARAVIGRPPEAVLALLDASG